MNLQTSAFNFRPLTFDFLWFLTMTFSEIVKRYLEIAGEFGSAVPLANFGLSKTETEKLFSAWDEDYQINRYMLLTLEAGKGQGEGKHEVYLINGFECTHITIQSQIQGLL
jgi:hypothetical protein